MYYYISILTMILLLLTSCGNDSSQSDAAEGTILTSHPDHVKNILFAHGYHDTSEAWLTFSNYIEEKDNGFSDWKIFKTDVDKSGSVANRAGELSDYINDLNISDDSLIVVAHSMGGLDTHYIVSKGHEDVNESGHDFKSAAKRIHKIYTLATPHRGNMFAGSPTSDAVHDMGIDTTRAFNAKYPYATFSVDDRKIPLLAFRFHCNDAYYSDGNTSYDGDGSTDGTVAVKRQVLFGAPHTQSIFHARHTDKFPNSCTTDKIETELSDTILKGILENKHYFTDTYDIVFYEKTGCEGEEDSFFSSTYKPGTEYCGIEQRCSNDKIASVKIYPSIKENTTIELYDSPSLSLQDDWMRIHVGKTALSEPFCIENLEHNHAYENNISVIYYENNGLNGKVSAFDIFESEENATMDIVLYEEPDCQGHTNGYFNSKEFNGSHVTYCGIEKKCANDKTSSLKIFPGIKNNFTIRLYDDPSFGIHDDWTRIHIGQAELQEPFCINGFEHDTSPREKEKNITTSYYNNNGLNGKVSSIKFDDSSEQYGPIDIVVHEDYHCEGDIVSSYNSRKSYNDVCGSGEGCSNDTAKSIRLYPNTAAHVRITLYNNKDDVEADEKDHGYTVITTGEDVLTSAICISGFDEDKEYSQGVSKDFHKHTNTCVIDCDVSGNVSYISVN